jgi:hypothetical protein
MIQITLYNAIVLYSVLLGLLAGAIWLYTEIATRRTYRFLEHQFLWRCSFCSYAYLDDSSDDISQCPRCNSLNVPGDKGARDPLLVPRQRASATAAPEPAAEGQRNPSRRKRPHQRRRGPRRRR